MEEHIKSLIFYWFSKTNFSKNRDFQEKLKKCFRKFYFQPETYRSKLLQSTANMRDPAMNARVGGRQDMAVVLAYVDKTDF